MDLRLLAPLTLCCLLLAPGAASASTNRGDASPLAPRPGAGPWDARRPVTADWPMTKLPDEDSPRTLHLEPHFGTAFPISVGVGAELQLPYRIRLMGRLGGMPSGYSALINDVVIAAGGWSEAEGALIEAGLKSALVAQLQVGWYPHPTAGFYFSFGGTLVTLGGALTSEEAVQALASATGTEVPGRAGERVTARVASTLHNIQLMAGYRWVIDPFRDPDNPSRFKVVVRAEGGLLHTVGSNTVTDFLVDDSRVDAPALSEAIDDYLRGLYTRWVWSPVVTVTVGVRIF